MLQQAIALKFWLKNKIENFIYEEDGAVDIVAVIILIGIVVALAIIFRKAIIGLVQDLLASITGGAKEAADTGASGN